jgi:hypothetical protein
MGGRARRIALLNAAEDLPAGERPAIASGCCSRKLANLAR